MNLPNTFKAATPFGLVDIDFPEVGGATFSGPQDAIDHLVHVMAQCTDGRGVSVSPQNLEPNTLQHFCQPHDGMVSIIPPLGLLRDEARLPHG